MAMTKGATFGLIGASVIGLLVIGLVTVGHADSPSTAGTADSEPSTVPFNTLYDIGRLWIRATSEQFRRIVDSIFQLPDFTRPWTVVLAALAAVAVYYLYGLFFVHLNRVRVLGSIGYITEGQHETMKDVMEVVKRRREAGDVPPVYPNGWFCVVESRALAVREVKNVHCVGKQLAVFRAEDGRAHIVDAYCPHNGANLAAGGIVRGNCLECPFHGWQFRGDDGKCTHIPYCDRKHIPETAKVTSYIALERNGFVFMWHDAEGSEPTWEPPQIEQIATGHWTYRGRTEHIINAHIQEVPENGADVAHLAQVHGPILTAGIDLRYMYNKWWSFAKHYWQGVWNQDADQKHVGILSLMHGVQIFGFSLPVLDMKVEARQIGPGIVHLTFDSPFGSGAFLQTLTPIEPLTQRIVHHVYFYRHTPTIIAKFFLLAEALMVERDIMIWNNKRYVNKPMYVKSVEDSLVQRHRRWYSQFYSEHSPRLKVNSDLSW